MAEVTDAAGLTARQSERRRRVVAAGVALAAEGGYDAVQMRDVAARAEVAMGTVYNYFSSKDHLLAAAMLDWIVESGAEITRVPARGSTTRARVLDLLHRFTGGMSQNRDLSEAVVTGFVSPGPEIAAIQEAMHRSWSATIGTAFGDEVPPERRDRIVRAIEHVWFSGLVAWVMGWMPLEQAIAELEDAVELLLA